MFEKIRKFYQMRLYTKKQVGDFVRKGVLTPDQYTDIVGEEYVA